MPVATGVENHSLTDGVDRLTLNYATAIEPGTENATVLATTSDLAYLTPEDDRLEPGDRLGTHPVATVEHVGRGRVVAVGDPSLVINAMLDRPDNGRFVRELYADSDRVLLDVSHAADLPPLTAAVLTIRDARPLQVLLGVGGVVAIAAASGQRARSIGRAPGDCCSATAPDAPTRAREWVSRGSRRPRCPTRPTRSGTRSCDASRAGRRPGPARERGR